MRAVILLTMLAAQPALADERNPTGSPPDWPMPMMDSEPFWMLAIDRLEYGDGDEGASRLFEVQGWYGGDYHKLWIESEGEGPTGESLELAELQVLYDRTVSPFWSLRAGARHDIHPGGEDVTYATLGFQGLAPQWFEAEVNAFVSEDGDLSLRGEAEYDLLLTQRLILQPRLELNVSADDVPELGVGSGISSTEAGIRLRYEIRREIAPYIGVRWERLYGDTRDLARQDDEPASSTWFVVGIKAWF